MFDAFLELEGVNGESKRRGFEGMIELDSFDLGALNPSTIGSGGGGGASKVSLKPITITKRTDAASPVLFQACCTGKHFPTAKITLHKAGGDEALDYLVFELEKVYVETIDWSGSSGGADQAVEQATLKFGKITATYTPQTETGAKGSPVVASWDVLSVSK